MISICCGGRHSLALALPDNEASSSSSSSNAASADGEADGSKLEQLPPGEPVAEADAADEALAELAAVSRRDGPASPSEESEGAL